MLVRAKVDRELREFLDIRTICLRVIFRELNWFGRFVFVGWRTWGSRKVTYQWGMEEPARGIRGEENGDSGTRDH